MLVPLIRARAISEIGRCSARPAQGDCKVPGAAGAQTPR